LLVAAGRRANTDGLGLDEIGVERDDKGYVQVDATGRTSLEHVWACGDVTGQNQFSHMAEHEAKTIVRNVLFPGRQVIATDIVPWSTFTDPELARVGLTEHEARNKFGDKNVQALRHYFRQDDRAITEDRAIGLVKIVVAGPNGKVVGAHIVGPGAGEMIHEWVLAMRHNLPVRAIADLVHVYPTVSVSSQRAAQRWYANLAGKPLVKGALRTLFGLHPRDAAGI
jgi:pyruvate/2-oxoglutarate dehydrogenase complex dihydrolipoamide dehydrogenase (E3) component